MERTSAFNIVGSGLLMVAATYGLSRYTYGLFVPSITETFSLGQSVIGVIGSASYMGYLMATLVSPFLVRRYGPRLPILLGGIFASLGMGLIGIAQTSLMLALGVIIAGCSPGLSYPPMSDAIKKLCVEKSQNRYYSLINSGTSFGILLSGPLALMVGKNWQQAWLLFSLIALMATLWCSLIMPGSPKPPTRNISDKNNYFHLLRQRLKEVQVKRLFFGALLFGLTTAIYWTFSIALLEDYMGDNKDISGSVFWILMGIAGLAGSLAGDLVTRFGLIFALRWSLLVITSAIVLLPASMGNVGVALLSATLFGATFILITALYGIWSTSCFKDAPAIGFGFTFFLISAGQLLSPALAGALAEIWSMTGVFYVTGMVSLLSLMLLPLKDIRQM